jgi:hypothetical protein
MGVRIRTDSQEIAMKYRVTWFKKDTGRVHSEGEYIMDNSFKEVSEHYRNNLCEGDDCCIMMDPDHFPHGKKGIEESQTDSQ